MTPADEWVEAGARALIAEGGAPGSSLHSWRCEDKGRYPEDCTCVADAVVEILAAVEPLIRADERERQTAEWTGLLNDVMSLSQAERAHDEAVAARLVEVICSLDSELVEERDRRGVWSFTTLSCGHRFALGDYPHGCPICEAALQRDAARAEVAALRERLLLSDYDPVPGLVARGVMSDEHDPDSCEMDCCRDVLAVLRAKVEGLPTRGVYCREVDEVFTMVFREAVLALFDGGDDRG